MQETEPLELSLASLSTFGGGVLMDIQEGDVLVVSIARPCSTETRDRAEADLAARIGAKLGRKIAVLVLEPEVSISNVLRAA